MHMSEGQITKTSEDNKLTAVWEMYKYKYPGRSNMSELQMEAGNQQQARRDQEQTADDGDDN